MSFKSISSSFQTKGSNLIKAFAKNPHKSRVYSEFGQINLKPVKRIQFKFDPFHPNSLSIRELMFQIHSKRVRSTHPECILRTDIMSDQSEPEVIVQLVNGHKLVYKTSHLNGYDVAKHYNSVVLPLLSQLEE